tara:strand:+ start:1352 stop:1993 length:642 start_codon:yes stop_codon:yes gene_type:complete
MNQNNNSQFIDIFPTVLYYKVLSNINVNSYINDILVNQEKISDGIGLLTTGDALLNEKLYKDLKNEILVASKEYLNEKGIIFEDILITNSWANILNKGDRIHNHYHSNSLISGAFYVTDSSLMEFYNPTLDNPLSTTPFFNFERNSNEKNHRTWNSFNLQPKSGTLLIFPSWLYHSVPETIQDTRISIAFNIFPKGKFGPKASYINLTNNTHE